MPEYAVAVVVAVVATLAYERWSLRSGMLRRRRYWLTLAVCAGFMVLTNGWLTKLSAPIVHYDPTQKTPWRFPWDIPVEDFAFAFVLLTLVLGRWDVLGRRRLALPATDVSQHDLPTGGDRTKAEAP